MKANKDVLETKWNEFRGPVLSWWKKRHNDQRNRLHSVRERSIRILQQRYGYSREEAASELDKHYSRAWLG